MSYILLKTQLGFVDLQERVHSEIKICDKILPFAFILSKNVSFTSETCIITSGDLYYYFRRSVFSLPGPALSLPGPTLLLPDLHYFTLALPSGKSKQTEGKISIITKMPSLSRDIFCF